MAGKTTLNAKNLEQLGAERLAELVMDLCEGSAPLKRHARAAVLEGAGTDVLANETRKRLLAIRASKAKVNWRKRPALLSDLTRQRTTIAERIAPKDAAAALDLMWVFLSLASPIFMRVDDKNDEFAALFGAACADLGVLAKAAEADPAALAAQACEALLKQSGFAELEGLIASVGPALGAAGLAALRGHLEADATRTAGAATMLMRRQAQAAKRGLMQIADAEGDVDAYRALIDARTQTLPRVAVDIAERLLRAERPAEALDALDATDHRRGVTPPDWMEARLSVLDALGRGEEAQALRWSHFKASLSESHLRAYLKQLPDFDDLEAEEGALDFVMDGRNVHRALAFLLDWPDHARAAAMVMRRRGELDGMQAHALGPAADSLEARHPLAATALRRAIIDDTLERSRSKRYAEAARHLLECESAAAVIDDYGAMGAHDLYVARLRDRFPRKPGFWDLV